MANYIKREVLSEAYTHLDVDLFNDKARLTQLKNELAAFYRDRASFLFETDVEVSVEFEEGSLRTRIVALGTAALVIGNVVGTYGSFRQGIAQLAGDAVSLAQAANLEVIFRTATPFCDRIRVENRKGVFGRVSALISSFDSVAEKIGSSKLPTTQNQLVGANRAIDELLEWELQVQKLFGKFDDPATQACVAAGLLDDVNKLPASLPWQKDLDSSTLRGQASRSDSGQAGEVAAASARYSAVLKQLKSNLSNQRASSVNALAQG